MPDLPPLPVKPGDVLCVSTPKSLKTRLEDALIKIGSIDRGKPAISGHVAVFSHVDKAGTPWTVEGRPGGVGWHDATDYLTSPFTVSNIGQPKTGEQRQQIVKAARLLLATPYDWAAIAEDTLDGLHLNELAGVLDKLWHDDGWDHYGRAPGHVVCSSLASWVYRHVGLDSPDEGRETQPDDWVTWILEHRYQFPVAA